jgi:hypothetical protein
VALRKALPRASHVHSSCPSNTLVTYPNSALHPCSNQGTPFENIGIQGQIPMVVQR